MCGIYGTTINYSEQQVKDKLNRIGFRGPDNMGWQFYKNDKKEECNDKSSENSYCI